MSIKHNLLNLVSVSIILSFIWSQALAHYREEENLEFKEAIEQDNSKNEDQTVHLIYDTHNIIEGSSQNIKQIYQLAKDHQDATLIFLYYASWCEYSKELMPEYELLSRKYFKYGEKNVIFVRVNGEKDPSLSDSFKVDRYPTIILQKVKDGELQDKIQFTGSRTAYDLNEFIRQYQPLEIEKITSRERFVELRNQIDHHFVLGVLHRPQYRDQTLEMIRMLQDLNTHIKFAFIEDLSFVPDKFSALIHSEIVIIRCPLLDEYQFVVEVKVTHDVEETNRNVRNALKSNVDYLDLENINLYTGFEKPIVAIVSTHQTIHNIEKNYPFYKVILKFLSQGGYEQNPNYEYAILNGLEIQDVVLELQLEESERSFNLIILEDEDTGYRYDGVVIRENESQPQVKPAQVINDFVTQYKKGQLKQFLKSETKETELVYEPSGILKLYGSNFIDVVHTKLEKPMFIMFTEDNSLSFAESELFFEIVSQQFKSFNFAKINTSKNHVSTPFRKYIFNHQLPAFVLVGSLSAIEQFNYHTLSIDEMKAFLDKNRNIGRIIEVNDEF
eukprot:403374694